MTIASKDDWDISPAPTLREDLGYSAIFTYDEFEKIKQGFIPSVMEEKWFIYFLDDTLYFHRSWTGTLIYAIKFKKASDGIQVESSWVNKDPEQYKSSSLDIELNLVNYFLRSILLKEKIRFPRIPRNRNSLLERILQKIPGLLKRR